MEALEGRTLQSTVRSKTAAYADSLRRTNHPFYFSGPDPRLLSHACPDRLFLRLQSLLQLQTGCLGPASLFSLKAFSKRSP